MSVSEINVDPRLFGERYCESVEVKDYEGVEAMETVTTGASVTNIHPDDVFSLPAIYAAVCRGVVRNLVSMAPPEVRNAYPGPLCWTFGDLHQVT